MLIQAITYYRDFDMQLKLIEIGYRGFFGITFHNGKYINGFPCSPCPNCGDEVMWYREYCWQYDSNGKIEHGHRCERCDHCWTDNGVVWEQGMTQDKFIAYWGFEMWRQE